jgi:hypothetical protein
MERENKMKKYLLIFASILLITSIACSFSVDVPKVKTGDTKLMEISEAIPADQEAGKLSIFMGGGTLAINPGENDWVTGTVEYNVPIWSPEITRQGKSLEISQETKDNLSFPSEKVKNDWQINIGKFPTDLVIKAGAYQGQLQLGGIPLTSLEINDGASQADVVFDKENPVVMSTLIYKTGASQINLEGLGFANAESINFDGGAGSYTFDFSGQLQRDLDVNINYGLGDVKIIVPKGVPAVVTVEGGLNNVELFGTWNIQGNDYELAGTGPKITFVVKMGLGNLQLISR